MILPSWSKAGGTVGIILLQRAWQAVGGLITVWLVASNLSMVDQGWYYSFLSLAACSSFFDLGMSIIVLQASARGAALRTAGERASPGLQQLVGHFQRLYARSIAVFLCFALIAGWFVFANADERSWIAPWVLLSGLTALNLWFVPQLAAWEGAGHIASVHLLRLSQGVLGSFLTWICLFTSDPLWAVLASPAISAVLTIVYLRKRGAFSSAGEGLQAKDLSKMSRLRFRVAATWLGGYLLIQISPPILLRLGMPEDAGRMGLSLALVNMIGLLAMSVLTSQVPRMAGLAEHRHHQELDTLFLKSFITSSLLYLFLASSLAILVFMGQDYGHAHRILPWGSVQALLIAGFCSHVISALATCLRSYYREPFAVLTLVMAVLSLMTLFTVAPLYGVSGFVLGFALLQCFFSMPLAVWLFFRERRNCRA